MKYSALSLRSNASSFSTESQPDATLLSQPLALAPTPKVCVIVRTYYKQAPDLRILLLSLLSQRSPTSTLYPSLYISVVNTDASPNPPTGFASWEALIATLSDPRVELSPLKPSNTNVPNYGYAESDREMARLMASPEKGCQYMMFTNGDNYYRPETLDAATSLMTLGVPAIGFNFLAPIRHQGADQKVNKVKACQFAHGQLDLGSVLISVDEIRRQGVTFEANKLPCPGPPELLAAQKCLAVESRPYWAADWGFVKAVVDGSGKPNGMACLNDGTAYLVTN